MCFGILLIWSAATATGWGQEIDGRRPLLPGEGTDLRASLPPDTHLLLDTATIERFLEELDQTPPDWVAVHGQGHHEPAHDERLVHLNRDRDAKREGNQALRWRVAFIWPGELSQFDSTAGGFRVAIGPKFNQTRWGIVRFKHEDLPGNLIAVPDPSQREALNRKFENRQKVEIEVVMTGRLIQNESIVYDFSHDEEGLGLIMPVVRIEQIDYVLSR